MSTAELLRKTVADFFEVNEGQVGPFFSLQGRRGQGSISRAALDSVIRRRVGLTSRSIYSAKTYGELEAELVPGGSVAPSGPDTSPDAGGHSPATIPHAMAATGAGTGTVRCGIDIELIDHLPRAADYWEDPFYQTCFTPAEIAYCLTQEMPAFHFAVRWCAKEALKKCDETLLAEELRNLEVVSEESGAPYLVHHAGGSTQRLPHAVSVSHTPHAAIAVVVHIEARSPSPASLTPEATAQVPPPAPSSPRFLGGVLPILLDLITLVVAVLALVRTFLEVK